MYLCIAQFCDLISFKKGHFLNYFLLFFTVVNLGFNEDDRTITEGEGPLRLKVVQLDPVKTFDSDVTLQLIPVDYDYVIENGIYSPSDFMYDPNKPNRAKGKGVNKNTQ